MPVHESRRAKPNGRPPAKRNQVLDYLRQRIIAGKLAPDAPLPSQQVLRQRFRTGADTVQEALRVLQAHGFIEAKPRRGTFVVPHPPHLSHHALIFPLPEKQMWESQFYRAIRDEAARMEAPDCRFSCFFNIGDRVEMADYGCLISDIKAHRLAGAVFAFNPLVLPGHLDLLKELTAHGMPSVAIALPGPTLSCPTVYPDLNSFTSKALQYLTSRGRRRIAHIVLASETSGEDPIPSAISDARRAFNLDPSVPWIQGVHPSAPAWARQAVRLLFHGDPKNRPNALIIHDDNLVPMATQGLADLGLMGGIEVVALANFPWPTPSAVPAKRLGFDIAEMMRVCREHIDQQRRGEQPPQHTAIPAVFDTEEGDCSAVVRGTPNAIIEVKGERNMNTLLRRIGWGLIAGLLLASAQTVSAVSATGGTVTNIGAYTIHTFTNSGTFTVTGTGGGNVDVLVVGGGGGGGGGTGGGGGAGGYYYTNGFTVTSGSNYPVIVGAGGMGGTGTWQRGFNGTNSAFGGLAAFGGGGGGFNATNGLAGGSGGGGGGGAAGGAATNGQGFAGGSNGTWSVNYPMAGGGGAGSNGANAVSNTTPGGGGDGRSNSISGILTWYAGGGGGGVYTNTSGAAGGAGGGGHGGQWGGVGMTGGQANTGGGGGGSGGNQTGPAGSGGSGIVIVRYSIAGSPSINNLAATNVTGTTATLKGYLSSTGMSATAVSVYWGTNDGGTVASNWAFSTNTLWPAPQNPGPLTLDITGLTSNTLYYYCYDATNTQGETWASPSQPFITGEVTIQATDASASESGADTGTITNSRPASNTK